VGRILVCPTEGWPGSGDQDLAEIGRHALGAETPLRHGHDAKNTRAGWPDFPLSGRLG
jgi:hypothetical protein